MKNKTIFLHTAIMLLSMIGILNAQTTMEWEITGTGNMNGYDGYYQNMLMDGSFHEEDFMFEENGYLRWYAFKMSWQNEWTLLPEETFMTKVNDLEIGDSWTSWFNGPAVMTVTDTGTIDTPVGSFFCYKTEIYLQSNPDSLIMIGWGSEDIGRVAIGDQNSNIGVLIDYSINGGSGFYPLETGNYWKIGPVSTSIESNKVLQSNCLIILNQNYPNPFSNTTSIGFTIVKPGHINLSIYNSQGELVSHLIDGKYPPDIYNIKWNGTNLSDGLYFCLFQYDDHLKIIKMNLIK